MKKVILIISFSTKDSEYENQEKPKFSWMNSKGEMLGIWEKEWGDIMLKRLVSHYPDYDCEIWQPELRADRIYSAQLHDRLIHRKFPAVLRTSYKRLKTHRENYSQGILDQIHKNDAKGTVFMLPAAVYSRWMKEIIGSIQQASILHYNLLNNRLLLPNRVKTGNPFKALNQCLINLEKTSALTRVQALLTPNTDPHAITRLNREFPEISVYELKWGLDHDFWQAVIGRDEAREILGIDSCEYVIVLSQRLVPEYQVDKFIQAVAVIRTEKKFSCYITGHGAREYEDHLKSLVIKHKLRDKVHFTGFVEDEQLRAYLIAADLFVSLPLASAGSGGALKAMAVGTPVLLTTSCGESYSFLREHEAGEYVAPRDYTSWIDMITRLIEGEKIRSVPREAILGEYNAKFTAESLNSALRHWDLK
jgi:glycosyltransferase involved in cell wall biosynthesis